MYNVGRYANLYNKQHSNRIFMVFLIFLHHARLHRTGGNAKRGGFNKRENHLRFRAMFWWANSLGWNWRLASESEVRLAGW